MELPPSYESAVNQTNAFGGRIGVFIEYYSTNTNSMLGVSYPVGNTTHESELSSQICLGAPVPIQNLVRQATINLAGQDAGEDAGEGGVEEGDCPPPSLKATAIIAIVLLLIMLCAIGLPLIILNAGEPTF